MTDTDLVRKPAAARVVAAATGLTPLERTGVAAGEGADAGGGGETKVCGHV